MLWKFILYLQQRASPTHPHPLWFIPSGGGSGHYQGEGNTETICSKICELQGKCLWWMCHKFQCNKHPMNPLQKNSALVQKLGNSPWTVNPLDIGRQWGPKWSGERYTLNSWNLGQKGHKNIRKWTNHLQHTKKTWKKCPTVYIDCAGGVGVQFNFRFLKLFLILANFWCLENDFL